MELQAKKEQTANKVKRDRDSTLRIILQTVLAAPDHRLLLQKANQLLPAAITVSPLQTAVEIFLLQTTQIKAAHKAAVSLNHRHQRQPTMTTRLDPQLKPLIIQKTHQIHLLKKEKDCKRKKVKIWA